MFDHLDFDDHESVTYVAHQQSGLRAIIAIHSTVFGPAGGGVRMHTYPSAAAALSDALRLSQGMTLKAVMAGLPLGGGKTVVIGDPADKTEAMFEALGDAIEDLGGRYFCGEDVGTCPDDMAVINRRTSHVVGLPGKSGDPSPATARSVFESMKAAVAHVFGSNTLAGVRVSIQGVGHVGSALAQLLADEEAFLTVADSVPELAEAVRARCGAEIVPPSLIHAAPADIFAPCALGGVINDRNLPELAAKIVCGAANNQLAEAHHGVDLHERGIVFVPDFVANVGGVISAMREVIAYAPGEFEDRITDVGRRVTEVLDRSRETGLPPAVVADTIARDLLASRRRASVG